MSKLLRRKGGKEKASVMNWEDFVDAGDRDNGLEDVASDGFSAESPEEYEEDPVVYYAEEGEFAEGSEEEFEEEPEREFGEEPEEEFEEEPEEFEEGYEEFEGDFEEEPEAELPQYFIDETGEEDSSYDFTEDEGVYFAGEAYEDYEDPADADYAEEQGEEEVSGEKDKKNVFALLWAHIVHMDTMDKIISATGIMILVVALVAGSIYASMRIASDQMKEFVSVGSALADVVLPGQAGLLAVADMEASKKAAAEALEEELRRQEEAKQQEQTEYHEEEYVNAISVTMKLSSIEKDLKVKFVNKKSGKLISNVPFSVEVKNAKGKSVTWTDDDLDGIIYQIDLEPGKYSVTVLPLENEKYKNYELPSAAQSVEVKKEIVYEKVDVSDEVKDETDVDVSNEETKPHEDVPEETMKDTVEWVESTQIPGGFQEIKKENIKAPGENLAFSGSGNVRSLASEGEPLVISGLSSAAVSVNLSKNELTLGVGGEGTESFILTAEVQGQGTGEGKWRSEKPEIAEVSSSDGTSVTLTAKAEGETDIVYSVTETVSGGDTKVTEGRCHVKVVKRQVQLDQSAVSVYVGSAVTVNITAVQGDGAAEVSAESSAAAASVSLNDAKNVLTIQGQAAGSAAATVHYRVNGADYKAVCNVTVLVDPKTDKTTELKDTQGNPVYVLKSEGLSTDNPDNFTKAVSADYYTNKKFYIMVGVKYTGWQTIDGKTYYYNKDGVPVTGEQVIKGASYHFDSQGALITNSGTLGIDVSKWNGTKIDWKAVKNSGISFVIIRCGYRGYGSGVLVEDPTYEANIKGALDAGLKVGVYFFTQAVNQKEAVEEASMVLEQVKNYRISYPIFLDVEHSGGKNGRADNISKEARTEVCKAFCQTIQNGGYTAGIYANKTWLTTMIDTPSLSAYKIWLAQYASQPTYTGKYDMWQYQSTGSVSGINGNVDMNWSYLGY